MLYQPVIAKTKMDIPAQKVEEKPTSSPPLFEMIQLGQPTQKKSSNASRWGNNPFVQEKPKVESNIKTDTPEPQGINIFEYKVSAIWKTNNTYKALLSGHIVASGDKLNDLVIVKITQQSITVKRKNKSKTFKLGKLFYDFQI